MKELVRLLETEACFFALLPSAQVLGILNLRPGHVTRTEEIPTLGGLVKGCGLCIVFSCCHVVLSNMTIQRPLDIAPGFHVENMFAVEFLEMRNFLTRGAKR